MVKRIAVMLMTMAGLLMLSGCSGYNLRSYYLPEKPEQKLPALKYPFDAESSAIGVDYVRHDFIQNLCRPAGDYETGYAHIKVVGGARHWSEVFTNRLLILLSGMTGTVINLLGVPMSRIPAEAYVEVKIYDSDLNLIGQYEAYGKGHAYITYFYGYTEGNAGKAAFSQAMREAQLKIREQVWNDRDKISRRLSTAGPIEPGGLNRLFSSDSDLGYGIRLRDNQREEIDQLRRDMVRSLKRGQDAPYELNTLSYTGHELFGLLSRTRRGGQTELVYGYCRRADGYPYNYQWSLHTKTLLSGEKKMIEEEYDACDSPGREEKCRVLLSEGQVISVEWLE